MNDRFLIVKRIKEFIFSIDNLIINLPRKEFIIKDRLLSDSFNVLELIYVANSNNSKEIKISILSKISMIDFYLEYLYEKKIISKKICMKKSSELEEITRMVYGWIKGI